MPTLRLTITPAVSRQDVFLIDRVRLPANAPPDLTYEGGGSFFLGQGRSISIGCCATIRDVSADESGTSTQNSLAGIAVLGWRWRRAPSRIFPYSLASLPPSPTNGQYPSDSRFSSMRHRSPRPLSLPVSVPVIRCSFSVVSALLEHLPASAVRLVVFNMDRHREFMRRKNFALAAIGDLADLLQRAEFDLAKTDVHTLQDRNGHLALLAGTINRELQASPPSDVVIFFGPRERFTDKLPLATLSTPRESLPRFIFLAYEAPLLAQLNVDPCGTNLLRAPG